MCSSADAVIGAEEYHASRVVDVSTPLLHLISFVKAFSGASSSFSVGSFAAEEIDFANEVFAFFGGGARGKSSPSSEEEPAGSLRHWHANKQNKYPLRLAKNWSKDRTYELKKSSSSA